MVKEYTQAECDEIVRKIDRSNRRSELFAKIIAYSIFAAICAWVYFGTAEDKRDNLLVTFAAIYAYYNITNRLDKIQEQLRSRKNDY